MRSSEQSRHYWRACYLQAQLRRNYGLFINKRVAPYLRVKIYIPLRLLNHPNNVSVCTIKTTKTSHSRFILVFLPLNEPLCTVVSIVESSLYVTILKNRLNGVMLCGAAADQCTFWKMDLNHGGAVVREEYQEIRSVFSTGRDHSGVSAVLFDPLEELVWTGNQSVGKAKKTGEITASWRCIYGEYSWTQA